MRPMSLAERGVGAPTVCLGALLDGAATIEGESTVGLEQYVEEILRSGFPGIRTARSERGLRAQLDGYLDRLFD